MHWARITNQPNISLHACVHEPVALKSTKLLPLHSDWRSQLQHHIRTKWKKKQQGKEIYSCSLNMQLTLNFHLYIFRVGRRSRQWCQPRRAHVSRRHVKLRVIGSWTWAEVLSTEVSSAERSSLRREIALLLSEARALDKGEHGARSNASLVAFDELVASVKPQKRTIGLPPEAQRHRR